MFNFLKKKTQTSSADVTEVTLKITGMHCTSCAMNIDGDLEDLPGVKSASTSYAKAQTTVKYDPAQASLDDIQKVIKKLGYSSQTS